MVYNTCNRICTDESQQVERIVLRRGRGNFFPDFLGNNQDIPARVRVREAMETGADVIAVVYPQCLKMFEDAINAKNLDDRLRIMDLSEIVMERPG